MLGKKVKYGLLLTLFAPTLAMAGNTDVITKERLDQFYKDSVVAQLAGEKEAVVFAQNHVHQNFDAVMHITSKMEGTPEQKETMILTKFEFIRDTKKSYKISSINDIKSGIVSYDIEKDERSANVKDRTYTMVSIPVDMGKDKEALYNLRQFIHCDSFYVLNRADVLQLKSSTCNVEGSMSEAQDL